MYGEHIASLQQSVRELQASLEGLQKIVGGNPKTPKPVRAPHSRLTSKDPLQSLESPAISGISSAIRRSGGGELGASQGQMLADLFSSMSRAMSRNL